MQPPLQAEVSSRPCVSSLSGLHRQSSVSRKEIKNPNFSNVLFSGELLVSTLTTQKRHKTSAPFAFAGAVGGPAEDLALMH